MDIFKQNKVLLSIIAILAILNLTLIGFIIWSESSHHNESFPNQLQPPHHPMQSEDIREVAEILKNELNLSPNQVEQIRNLRTDFFKKEEDLIKIIRSERDSMNSNMFKKDINEELVKNLAKRVSENEYKMELLRFEQAKQFKSICTPEQLEKFEGLVREIRDYFKPDEHQPRPDNKPERK
jgi:Spy/CpxP family protein refolding chaperone